jgi:pimeloyl-ACP methyl ester carboxylesterase
VRTFAAKLAVLMMALGALVAAPAAQAHGHSRFPYNPVIFVHGGAGSGAQFESQKLRFTSNGYPSSYVRVIDYDSLFTVETRDDVYAKIDALVAELQRETGKAKIDILGHSLGTAVMQAYLSTPARAANVGHYVNIDGAQAASPPGGVPTLAIWSGRGTPGRTIGGAENVTVANQTHVQSATSPESFRAIFKFFTGHEPATVDPVPEHGKLRIAGKAVLFPQNVGVEGATVEVWQVDGSTGQRRGQGPVARLAVAADGGWGPVWLKPGRHYEFAISREGSDRVHHFYPEPFVRSDDLVRLLTSNPGEGLDLLVEKSERHSSLVITRYKEFWGDQGAENDVLTVNGTNLVNAATAPIGKRLIGLFAFDAGSDGVSHVDAPLAALAALPFISGVDDYIPASADGSDTIPVSLTSRGTGPTRTVNVPNRPSTTDTSSVIFNDFERVARPCKHRSHHGHAHGWAFSGR